MVDIPAILNTSIYTVEKEQMGHTIINGKGIEILKGNKKNVALLTAHLITEIRKSLEVSKKYGKTIGNVHLYLKGCTLRSLSISMFKKIVRVLSETFEDTLNYCYIYDISKLATMTWNLVKHFVDPETRRKILIVKTQLKSR